MNRTLTAFIATTSLLGFHEIANGGIRYSIQSVALSNGYAIASGYVDTDGTLGAINVSNITDYVVDVTGPNPYTFSSVSPGITLSLDDAVGALFATATDLVLTSPGTMGTTTGLSWRALDNSRADCTDCRFTVNYSINNISSSESAGYSLLDVADNDPTISAGASFPLDQSITIASVPEPSAFIFLSAVGLGLLVKKYVNRKRSA